jgi:predicted nuclease of restriction endonuclease-like (RecB) superfamily
MIRFNFESLIEEINKANNRFQLRAAKSIDHLLTMRNWLIGAFIVEFEQNGEDKAKYGSKLEKKLSEKINTKGFSERNLKLFKQFYLTYPQMVQTVSALKLDFDFPITQTLSALLEKNSQRVIKQRIEPDKLLNHLSFSHFVELLNIEDISKREFYEIRIIQSTLSVRELKNQINNLSFERTLAAQDKTKVLNELEKNAKKESVSSILKTPYVFDFLGFSDQTLASESALENALLADLKSFMLELGHGFCFENQQKRIVIGGEYYFVDLVFYHRILKCHVLIELKIDSFKHEYAGQLNTYLQYYKSNIQEKNDNPPIGILLCTNQNTELVKYALGGMDNNLFVNQYQTALPSQEELTIFLQNEKKKLQ